MKKALPMIINGIDFEHDKETNSYVMMIDGDCFAALGKEDEKKWYFYYELTNGVCFDSRDFAVLNEYPNRYYESAEEALDNLIKTLNENVQDINDLLFYLGD